MSENIQRNKVKRPKFNEFWGSITEIIVDETYNVYEYEINTTKKAVISLTSNNSAFIVVSGSAEFFENNQKKKLFKGDKFICSNTDCSKEIFILNCGVIPLLIIRIDL